MKLLVITFTTDLTNPGYLHLVESLKKHGYDFETLTDSRFSWGGDNYSIIAEWLKQNRKDYTHILYTDAWDTLAFAGPEVLLSKFGSTPINWVFSGEKNPCFAKRLEVYATNETRWPFLCAGGYICQIDLYIRIVETYPRNPGENDQQYASRILEEKIENIWIDRDCSMFQTLYNMKGLHQPPNTGEFAINDQYEFVNLITGTKPIFVHGNGKVDMRSIYHSPYKK